MRTDLNAHSQLRLHVQAKASRTRAPYVHQLAQSSIRGEPPAREQATRPRVSMVAHTAACCRPACWQTLATAATSIALMKRPGSKGFVAVDQVRAQVSTSSKQAGGKHAIDHMPPISRHESCPEALHQKAWSGSAESPIAEIAAHGTKPTM